jgi:hypothetical protein
MSVATLARGPGPPPDLGAGSTRGRATGGNPLGEADLVLPAAAVPGADLDEQHEEIAHGRV